MDEKSDRACSAASKLIFACSGAVDVGEIADRVARKLTAEGKGKMFCTAGLGGRVGPIMKTTEVAEKVVAIDGCALDCVRLSLELAGFTNFAHVRVTDLGMEKGKSPATDERVARAAEKAASLL